MNDWNVSNPALIGATRVIPAKAGIQEMHWIPGQARNDELHTTHILLYNLSFDIPLSFACLPVGRDFDI